VLILWKKTKLRGSRDSIGVGRLDIKRSPSFLSM